MRFTSVSEVPRQGHDRLDRQDDWRTGYGGILLHAGSSTRAASAEDA